MSKPVPQASASTNSAIRAMSSVTDGVSQENGTESSVPTPDIEFPLDEKPAHFQGDRAGILIPHRGPDDLAKLLAGAGRVMAAAMPDCCKLDGFVYIVAGGDLVKIGMADDIGSRMGGLQSGCPVPLKLLALGRGYRRSEALLHARFASSRRHGEWFTASTVKSWLRTIRRDICLACADNESPYWTPKHS